MKSGGLYMMKLAAIHELNGDYSEALDIYNTIAEDFKDSREASGIEKYISKGRDHAHGPGCASRKACLVKNAAQDP